MLRILIFVVRLAVALALVVFVFWAIVEVTLFSMSQHMSLFSGIPWWKSVLVSILVLLSAVASVYAAHRMIRYAIDRFRGARWGY
jgi:hypothetical protein